MFHNVTWNYQECLFLVFLYANMEGIFEILFLIIIQVIFFLKQLDALVVVILDLLHSEIRH